MAQKEFGRRQAQPVGGGTPTRAAEASSAPSPDATETLALADAPSRSTTRNVMILAAVGGLVMVVALGAAYALNASISSGDGSAEAKHECLGQPKCTNQYEVTLTCGSSDEPKSVSIVAADAEAAERKAERYNRDCRSRRAVFVSSLIRSAAYTAFGGQRADEAANSTSRNSTATRRVWRFRRR